MKKSIVLTAAVVIAAGTLCGDNARKMDKDSIINGVHGYMPANYVQPKEEAVLKRLEWFKDQKLALMMHWGIYAQSGNIESWPLSDSDASWSRSYVDWIDDAEEFKAQYWRLATSFNPVRFRPDVWASLAQQNGFRYLVFTTKHHDGFCMFDSKYSNFKVTSPNCPFSKNPKANIVKHVFDAFREKGLGIAAYFSKPDWSHPDYWENRGLGYKTDRMPSYDVTKEPARWERFVQFTKNQILELVNDYGPIDAIWLDGGQVQRNCGLDIRIEEIIAEARKTTPGLISVDRTAGGTCENVITPEQTVPPKPLAVPWESCVTMGTGFSYRFDDVYKSPRELIHLLIDIVAKGGNLALNVAPGPDGRLPREAISRMKAMGAWLSNNGEAIYGTRPVAPYRTKDWAFTKKKNTIYAIRLWTDKAYGIRRMRCPLADPQRVGCVKHLATGTVLPFTVEGKEVCFTIPADIFPDDYADAFEITEISTERRDSTLYFFDGIVGGSKGWNLVRSEKGKVVYIPFEGYYESKGGRIESKKFDFKGARYAMMSFSAKAVADGYWWLDLYDAEGKLLPDINSRLHKSERWREYSVVMPISKAAVQGQIAFVCNKGVSVKDVRFDAITVSEAASWCDKLYSTLPKINLDAPASSWDKLPRSKEKLLSGKPLKVVLLGDSIMNDTYCGNFTALVQREFPNVEFVISVRGSTGCWYYRDPKHFEEYVLRHKPDLVLAGGISNAIDTFVTAEQDMIDTINNAKAAGIEVGIVSPPPSYEWRRNPSDVAWDEDFTYTAWSPWLKKVCYWQPMRRDYQRRAVAKTGVAYWDVTTAPANAIAASRKPINWFKRDAAHNDDRGKQLIARALYEYFRAAKK